MKSDSKMQLEIKQVKSRVQNFLQDYRKLEEKYPDIIVDTDDGCSLTLLIDMQKNREDFEPKYFGILGNADGEFFTSTDVEKCEISPSADTILRFKNGI